MGMGGHGAGLTVIFIFIPPGLDTHYGRLDSWACVRHFQTLQGRSNTILGAPRMLRSLLARRLFLDLRQLRGGEGGVPKLQRKRSYSASQVTAQNTAYELPKTPSYTLRTT